MTIKAIQTQYNGYLFRSRLEARWAVFFDAAGIEYQYEPEGYEDEFGNRYLPDFYLPQFDVYVEVKPNDEMLFKDSEKIGALVDFNSSPISRGLVILGDIPYYELPLYGGDLFPAHYCIYCDQSVALKLIRFKMRRHGYPTEMLDVEDCIDYCTEEIPKKASTVAPFYYNECVADKDTGLERDAYMAARQARFEHGETPVMPYV